jgi:hypothetical protein
MLSIHLIHIFSEMIPSNILLIPFCAHTSSRKDGFHYVTIFPKKFSFFLFFFFTVIGGQTKENTAARVESSFMFDTQKKNFTFFATTQSVWREENGKK